MQYKKVVSGDTIIEFHNNWLGEETVIVHGKIVSKKSSIMGAHHPFTVVENGEEVRYVLSSKVSDELSVFLDLRKNGEIVQADIPVKYGFAPSKPQNAAKDKGIVCLNKYEIKEAIKDLKIALDIDPVDPEINFYLACAYSLSENATMAFEQIKKAIENKLQGTESILTHDMLAFVRIHPAFEEFLHSGFKEYKIG
ncbi:MAG: hypothetical protein ABIV51_03775 [Saprospiraceae bacterium]